MTAGQRGAGQRGRGWRRSADARPEEPVPDPPAPPPEPSPPPVDAGEVAAVPLPTQLARLRKRVKALEDDAARADASARLTGVEAEIQELRGLSGRVAELADLITELLVAAARREDPQFKEILEKYLDEV